MSRREKIILSVFLFGMLVFPLRAHAEIYRLFFNPSTQNDPYSTPEKTINFYIQVNDTSLVGREAVTSLKVEAPDATVFDMTENYWNESSLSFSGSFQASDFKSGKIPSGTYEATVIDKSGKQLAASKKMTIGFLAQPKITDPVNGAGNVNPTPRIRWNMVTGAQYYRLVFNGYFSIEVNKPQFTVPQGVLRPNTTYNIRIEAIDSDKGASKFSRSSWVTFTTAP